MSEEDLFSPRVDETKFHPNFKSLRESNYHGDARKFMGELYSRMGDPNGNFVQDFQSCGFHARIFELASYAYLQSAGCSIDRSYGSPDFIVSRGEITLAVEVTTASPKSGSDLDISLQKMQPLSQEQINEKVSGEFPRRISSLLRKKLAKQYQVLPHCVGRPLVLMVAPFFEPGAVFYSDDALTQCLYGLGGIADGKEPFFELPDAVFISAVLYCNQFTVPRFYRLAAEHHGGRNLTAIRKGVAYLGDPEDNHELMSYEFQVGSPMAPTETWAEGVTIFHNSCAKFPLPGEFLPCTSSFSIRDGRMIREVYGFHPVVSVMEMYSA